MKRDELNDLAAFAVVAQTKSFTHAASQLGMSSSALSHAMKALEARLDVRLLARTTRSVSTTEAGERLLRKLRPALEDIRVGLAEMGQLRDRPAGLVRITTFRYAATAVVWPKLPAFLDAHPNVSVELSIDEGLTDIVESRFDAGIRWGESVAKDMIAVRVSPDIRLAVVGSPAYFARHGKPRTPQQLADHRCINYRLHTAGGLHPWDFERNEHAFQVRPSGTLIFNDGELALAAALAGQGLAYVYEDQVAMQLSSGALVRVLDEWCPTYSGFFLYHPSRRQTPPALAALINALRV